MKKYLISCPKAVLVNFHCFQQSEMIRLMKHFTKSLRAKNL